ncbi:MAG: tetratricopeptide repeat protein [Chloroflexota bacterium]
MHLSLSLLGKFQAVLDGEPLPESRSKKIEALLIYLVMERQQAHRRESLVGLFFPDMTDEDARTNLRQTLRRLSKTLQSETTTPSFLRQQRESLQFNVESDYHLDVAEFETLIAGCAQHRPQANQLCADCIRQFQQAVMLYTGPFLDDFFLEDCPAFENWLQLQRTRLEYRAHALVEALSSYHERRGEYALAVFYARRRLEMNPWSEEATRQVMRLLAYQGQRNVALAHYNAFRDLIRRELGVELMPETAVLRDQIALVGEKRPHNLTLPDTSFIGRAEELAQIHQHLINAQRKLLTLIGMGGIGKTRLALEAAHRAAAQFIGPFMHGIFFVPLAPITDVDGPTSIITAIADAIGLTFSGSQTPQQQLLTYLQQKTLLLILDNFEHLVVPGRELVQSIMQQAPTVQLLLTSRERLHLDGEWVLDIGGLSVPPNADDMSSLDMYQAVQLFTERARRVDARFSLDTRNPRERAAVVKVCQLVQGMPLAIELATAWVHVLTCQEIAQEIARNLDLLASNMYDLPTRHRSIRAVFDHSWQLLPETEQQTLAQLAIFRGGFDRHAAAIVAGASLSHLAALLDKSFLHRTQDNTFSMRYDFQEVLRQYAIAHLTEQDLRALRHRHAAYYTQFLADHTAILPGINQQQALADVRQEIENCRAAWQWAVQQGQSDWLQAAFVGLATYYEMRNWFQEGSDTFMGAYEYLLQLWGERPTERQRSILLAQLQAWAGWFSFHLGQFAESAEILHASLEQLQCWQADAESVFTLNYLGAVTRYLGDVDTAVTHLNTALTIARQNNDQFGTSVALNNLGLIASQQTEYEQARTLCQESLTIKRAIGDRWGTAISLTYLGRIAQATGEHQKAHEYFQESLTISESVGDRRWQAFALRNLGNAAHALGQDDNARRYYEQSLAIFRTIGNQAEAERTLSRWRELQPPPEPTNGINP